MAGLLRGGKSSSRHQTLTVHAKQVYSKLKKYDDITKIIVGIVRPVQSGRYALKYRLTPTSIELTVKSPREIQLLYLIGPDISKIETIVKEFHK